MTATLYLIRHGERDSFKEGEVGDEILLTPNGLENSKKFGEALNNNIVQIRTSPIPRCIQTAQMMAKGANFPENKIEECSNLGDPGIFISNGAIAWQHWEKHGSEGVNKHLLHGTEHWEGFNDLNSATQELMSLIEDQLEAMKENETSIWVTHDTILATFAARILSTPFTIDEWPNFLDYIRVKRNLESGIHLEYIQAVS